MRESGEVRNAREKVQGKTVFAVLCRRVRGLGALMVEVSRGGWRVWGSRYPLSVVVESQVAEHHDAAEQ
jgi:hypothetical protein